MAMTAASHPLARFIGSSCKFSTFGRNFFQQISLANRIQS
jgi:hypothetical protein